MASWRLMECILLMSAQGWLKGKWNNIKTKQITGKVTLGSFVRLILGTNIRMCPLPYMLCIPSTCSEPTNSVFWHKRRLSLHVNVLFKYSLKIPIAVLEAHWGLIIVSKMTLWERFCDRHFTTSSHLVLLMQTRLCPCLLTFAPLFTFLHLRIEPESLCWPKSKPLLVSYLL